MISAMAGLLILFLLVALIVAGLEWTERRSRRSPRKPSGRTDVDRDWQRTLADLPTPRLRS